MAVAIPGFIVKSISGRIGNVVFYTRRRSGKGTITQCIRTHVIPRNPDTEAQRAVRRSFGDAVREWQSMSPDEQYSYNRKARNLNMSGYNLYISIYMKSLIRNNKSALMISATQAHTMNSLSFPQNPELSTLNLFPVPEQSQTLCERIPSVSIPYQKANTVKTSHRDVLLTPG
jgi:hypothetical protein